MSLFHKNTLLGASGAGGAEEALYVDDVFSTFLYRNDTNYERNNGIDLSGEGGLVVTTFRSSSSEWGWTDSERGITKSLDSSSNGGEATEAWFSSFDDDGFTTGSYLGTTDNADVVSWTFRKAPGFFDVVTYTGTGSAHAISHNLGSTPGMILIKKTNAAAGWACYHRSLGATQYLDLSEDSAAVDFDGVFNDTEPTSTQFTVGTSGRVNDSGGSYVAYIFAHDDQSFGTDSDEAIIKCDSVTLPSSGYQTSEINLGFEPQFLLLKNTTFGPSNWFMFDNVRGITSRTTAYSGHDALLQPNRTNAEATDVEYVELTPNGFKITIAQFGTSQTIAYMAIRRPHKPPTDGDDVFKPVAATNGDQAATTGFVADHCIWGSRGSSIYNFVSASRLTGKGALLTTSTAGENTGYFSDTVWQTNDGMNSRGVFSSSTSTISWFFKRAPGFFDVVAYTATNQVTQNVSHNLGVAPELMIFKSREVANQWWIYAEDLGADKVLTLGLSSTSDDAAATSTSWLNNTAPTSSVFTLGSGGYANWQTGGYIAYLFASLDGISKVGTYSGTGSDVNVDCGFTSGARFVLVKRTDSTGHWYVWDSARGIASGNEPYAELNKTSGEATGSDFIDPLNSGFTITSSAPTNINANGGTYLFLAIA